jgi:hypothetical protein
MDLENKIDKRQDENTIEISEKTGFYLLTGWIITTLIWWSFAFAPITSEAPDWLKRAQYVCFGSLPGGLPNSGGWLLLIGGPLMLLLSLLVGFYDELKKGLNYISHSQFAKIFYASLIVFTLWQTLIITKKIKNVLEANTVSFENIDSSIFVIKSHHKMRLVKLALLLLSFLIVPLFAQP